MIVILNTGQSTHKQEQRQASYFPMQNLPWDVFDGTHYFSLVLFL